MRRKEAPLSSQSLLRGDGVGQGEKSLPSGRSEVVFECRSGGDKSPSHKHAQKGDSGTNFIT